MSAEVSFDIRPYRLGIPSGASWPASSWGAIEGRILPWSGHGLRFLGFTVNDGSFLSAPFHPNVRIGNSHRDWCLEHLLLTKWWLVRSSFLRIQRKLIRASLDLLDEDPHAFASRLLTWRSIPSNPACDHPRPCLSHCWHPSVSMPLPMPLDVASCPLPPWTRPFVPFQSTPTLPSVCRIRTSGYGHGPSPGVTFVDDIRRASAHLRVIRRTAWDLQAAERRLWDLEPFGRWRPAREGAHRGCVWWCTWTWTASTCRWNRRVERNCEACLAP